MYVYNSCDYFVLLDIHNNSYMMINSNPLETACFSAVCDKYESALVEYARSFVVPEDQEAVIRKMSIDNVARQLEDKEVYSFTAGVEDPERGYTRKQLTYRYYDRAAGTVLLCRTDVTEVYLEERAPARAGIGTPEGGDGPPHRAAQPRRHQPPRGRAAGELPPPRRNAGIGPRQLQAGE